MTSTQNLDPRVAERIETATEVAKKLNRTFVAATFRVIAERELVKITIPNVTAKYLKKVSEHSLLVFTDDMLTNVIPIDIKAHAVHGDFPVKRADNSQRARVIRHFYVLPDYYGETIAAFVTLKEKCDLITGETTIIVDIQQSFSDGPLTVAHKLSMGVPAAGATDEAIIPNSENLCCRFEAINPLVIEPQNSDIATLNVAN